MEFRPCIDIHNGKVKQIVGSSLRDEGDFALVNSDSKLDAEALALLYKRDGIKNAHVIMLNSKDSEYFAATKEEALKALKAYPGGLQIGGGVNAGNAKEYIDAGASHVIVTSFAFSDGEIKFENLKALRAAVGKEHTVLDLSAAKRDGKYYVVTDRWQKFTKEELTPGLFDKLSEYCDEFLVHATDSEGLRKGPDTELAAMLSRVPYTVTYAGGIASVEDIRAIGEVSGGRLNFTVGSALDLFGGNLKYEEIKDIQ